MGVEEGTRARGIRGRYVSVREGDEGERRGGEADMKIVREDYTIITTPPQISASLRLLPLNLSLHQELEKESRPGV